MAGIKITPADRWFSLCVRESANWTCEYCGTKYEEKAQGLHASHYYGRGNYSLRFCPDNVFAHCFSCHLKLGSNPNDFVVWVRDKIGEGAIDILIEKRNDLNLAKFIKKDLKSVAAHYKSEYEKLRQQRAEGATGKLQFTEY